MPPACCVGRTASSYVSSLQNVWAMNRLDAESNSIRLFKPPFPALALLLFSSIAFSLRLKYHAAPMRISLPPCLRRFRAWKFSGRHILSAVPGEQKV